MDIGVGLFNGQQHPDDDRPRSAVYREMVDLVEHADDVGLDSAWVSEHHFTPDGYMSSLLPTLGAFAGRTDQITLGTSMTLAPLHDAVRLAEDAATVSLLSEGRLVLGLANGYRKAEFDGFGVDRRERSDRTEEAVRIARAAWTDGPLGFDPRYHPADADVEVTPVPDDPPRITLGGTSKPAVRRAAMIADAWTGNEPLSLDDVVKRVRYQRRLRDVEKIDRPFTTYLQRYCFVDDTAEAAWERIRDAMFYVQRTYDQYHSGEVIDELSAERKQLLRDQTIVGSPEEVVEELTRYGDAIPGDLHVILRPYFPGVDPSAVERCIERMGDEVAPALR
ncbi:MAG: LLM class flavin-dependent oxidoreductase [Halobacteriales archaeon]|nr:LLM class flavin-dependent oxidoreductase [Halobacteriales archaeon]